MPFRLNLSSWSNINYLQISSFFLFCLLKTQLERVGVSWDNRSLNSQGLFITEPPTIYLLSVMEKAHFPFNVTTRRFVVSQCWRTPTGIVFDLDRNPPPGKQEDVRGCMCGKQQEWALIKEFCCYCSSCFDRIMLESSFTEKATVCATLKAFDMWTGRVVSSR